MTVSNTLARYFEPVSPTRFVFQSQLESGLYGPVRILVTSEEQQG